MRDLILVSDVFNGIVGGEQRLVSMLANAWIADRKVVLMTFDKEDSIPFFSLDPKIEFIRLAKQSRHLTPSLEAKPNFFCEAFSNLYRIIVLRKALKKLRGKLADPFIVSFGTYRSVVTLLASFGLRLPIVCSEHTDPTKVGRVWSSLRRLTFPRAYAVTVLTEKMKTLLPKAIQNKSWVIPNPILPASQNEEVSTLVRKPFILTVGRFHIDKCIGNLIEVFGYLADEFPNWSLLIVGEGSLRRTFESLVQSLGLKQRVLMPGALQDLQQVYKSSDIFVLNSRYEGFPLALSEAMAHGVASIATDCSVGGPAELIQNNESGILIPVDSPTELTAALRHLMHKPSERIRLGNAAKDVVRNYSLSDILIRWDAVFCK